METLFNYSNFDQKLPAHFNFFSQLRFCREITENYQPLTLLHKPVQRGNDTQHHCFDSIPVDRFPKREWHRGLLSMSILIQGLQKVLTLTLLVILDIISRHTSHTANFVSKLCRNLWWQAYLYTIRRSGSPNFLAIRVLFQHVFRDCAAFETFGEGMGGMGGAGESHSNPQQAPIQTSQMYPAQFAGKGKPLCNLNSE